MNKEKHIILKVLETPVYNINPIERDSDYMLQPELKFKVNGAKDIIHYNRLNDIINITPEGFTEEEQEEVVKKLAKKLGCKVEDLNPYNKEGWLRGHNEYTVTLSKSNQPLKPKSNPLDALRVLIILSNKGFIVSSKEEMAYTPDASYFISEPEQVQNVQADEYEINTKFFKATGSLTDDLPRLQSILEVYNYTINSPIRLAEGATRKTLTAKLNELSKDLNSSKRLVALLEEKNLEDKIEIVNYLYKGFIKYRSNTGFELEGTDIHPSTFQELVNFLATPANAHISSSLKSKMVALKASMVQAATPKSKGRPKSSN